MTLYIYSLYFERFPRAGSVLNHLGNAGNHKETKSFLYKWTRDSSDAIIVISIIYSTSYRSDRSALCIYIYIAVHNM